MRNRRHEHEFEVPDRVEADEYVYIYNDCIGECVGSYTDYERDEVYEEWVDCPATKVQYYKPVAITHWADYDTEDVDLRIEESAFEWLVDEAAPLVEDPLMDMADAFNEMNAEDAHAELMGWKPGSVARRWTAPSEAFSIEFELESEEVHQ